MKINKISLLLLAALLLGGCSLGLADERVEQSPNEVLLAQDCGMDGLRCCADEPKCFFGQECCIDPNDTNKTQCLDQCSCGDQDQFCCADNQCDQGFACLDGSCQACGAEDQPCCGEICQPAKGKNNGQLICYDGSCLACGQLNTLCCQGAPACRFGVGTLSLGFCSNGLCAACGGNEEPACPDGACLKGYLLSEGRCYQCGKLNQPCCENNSCQEGSLYCLSGFCQPR